MNDERFDGLVRQIARAGETRTSRRGLMRAAGIGGAAIASAVGGSRVQRAIAQEATPVPTVLTNREPGAPNLGQLAADLLYDPQEIFRFVRDEVFYDPYTGVLRGATGTLWGLAGNSADQAVLLAAILNEALVETRFVFGELDDAAAARLLQAAMRDDAAVRAHVERVMGFANPGAPAGTTPALTAEQQAEADRLVAEGTVLVEETRAAIDRTVQTLEAALAGAGVTLPSVTPQLPGRERRQHVWVQYADGGYWIDLDPSFPDAEPGKAVGTVTETLAELPDELYHRVTVRSVAEVNAGGTLARQEVLTYSARAADLAGVPLTLMHIQPAALKAVGMAISGVLEGTEQYQPHLVAGKAGETGTMLTFGGGQGIFDTGAGGPAEGEAIAEWLEFEVSVPDQPVRREVREVFDRLGIERRAAGDLDLATVEPIALTDIGEGEPGYLPLMALTRIVVTGHEIPGAYFVQDYAIDDAEADLALPIYGYHYTRVGLVLDRLAELGHRLYPDAPNVTAMVLEPRLGKDQSVQGDATIDLIYRSLAAIPTTGSKGTANPLLVGGVIGHAAEQAIVEGGARRARETGQKISVASVGAIFDAAGREGVALRVLQPGAGEEPPPGISPEATERIAGALAAGYVVVVPERPVTVGDRSVVGWWQIDPATGETFDVLENGRGAARFVSTNENGVPLVQIVVRGAPVYKKMRYCIFFISMGASMLLGGIGAMVGGALAGGTAGEVFVPVGAGGALGGASTAAAGIACAVA